MHTVQFKAYGHKNVIADHRTTLEITTEKYLTKRGTCIVGVKATVRLSDLPPEIRQLVTKVNTMIILLMEVEGVKETVKGTGGADLRYTDAVSLVARTSTFQCGRTLMINADKAAAGLKREFVQHLKNEDAEINCELRFIPGE